MVSVYMARVVVFFVDSICALGPTFEPYWPCCMKPSFSFTVRTTQSSFLFISKRICHFATVFLMHPCMENCGQIPSSCWGRSSVFCLISCHCVISIVAED